jgi:hypothetical protein
MRWRSAALATLLAAAPAVARADDPGAPNSIYPEHIRLTGHDGAGVSDPRGRFTVTIRNVAFDPLPGITVTIDVSGAQDLRLCATPALPGLTVDCVARTVSGVTNAQGQVEFAIFGWAENTGNGMGSGAGAARIRAYTGPCCTPGGVVVLDAPLSVSACDQSGGDGVNSLDISRFLADFGAGGYPARSDHDHSGFLGITDFAVLLQSLGDGRSSVGCAGPAGGSCP